MDKVAALTVNDWLKSQIASEPYWFHRMELPGGLVTPGWNDPKVEKLPYFGLPDNMTGMRVLDIGHAEGFFPLRQNAEELPKLLVLRIILRWRASFRFAGRPSVRVRRRTSQVFTI